MRGAATASGGIGVPATRSVFYRDSERVMGWDVVDSGFKIVLSAKVPTLVRENIRRDVDAFLQQHELQRSDIHHWVVHTGGPKVLEAFAESLELPTEALSRSWDSLRQVGNLSSASVLFVLREFMARTDVKPGEYGILLAMGPGFCSELVLLKW
jgi:alkylresorcinol/alkylpyrone synthase